MVPLPLPPHVLQLVSRGRRNAEAQGQRSMLQREGDRLWNWTDPLLRNFSEYFKQGDFLCVKIMIVMTPYQDVWGPTERVDELADSA